MEHYDGDIQEQFETWWKQEVSCVGTSLLTMDERFVKEKCNYAWLSGAYCAEQNLVQSDSCTGCAHETKSSEYINCTMCVRNTSDLFEPIGGFKR